MPLYMLPSENLWLRCADYDSWASSLCVVVPDPSCPREAYTLPVQQPPGVEPGTHYVRRPGAPPLDCTGARRWAVAHGIPASRLRSRSDVALLPGAPASCASL